MVDFKIIKHENYSYIDSDDLTVANVLNIYSQNRAMVYVLNRKKLIGVIGKSEILKMKQLGRVVVNKNGTYINKCKFDDRKAKELFERNMNWSGIPVVNKQGEMVYEYRYSIRAFYDELQIDKGNGINHEPRKEKIVISMTTHDERLRTVYLALKSLMHQTMKADEIFLYLAKGSGDGELTREEELKKAGVIIIRGLEDLTCHKKYYYAMKEKQDSVIITADDDSIYDKCFVESLFAKHRCFSDAVICKFGERIRYKEDEIMPYNTWNDCAASVEPETQICIKSYAGVLYPIGKYRMELLDKDSFLLLSEYNDDLWITACLQELGIRVYNMCDNQAQIIEETQEVALWNGDITSRRNDKYVKNLREYFRKAYRKL